MKRGQYHGLHPFDTTKVSVGGGGCGMSAAAVSRGSGGGCGMSAAAASRGGGGGAMGDEAGHPSWFTE